MLSLLQLFSSQKKERFHFAIKKFLRNELTSIIIRLKNSFKPIKRPNGGAIIKGNRYAMYMYVQMNVDCRYIWNSKIPFAIMLIAWLLMLLPKFTNYMLITEYPFQKSPQSTLIAHSTQHTAHKTYGVWNHYCIHFPQWFFPWSCCWCRIIIRNA